MPPRIGKGKLTEVQKEALGGLYLAEMGEVGFPSHVSMSTWNNLEKKNFIFTDEDNIETLTPFGINVAKMILRIPL